MEIERRKQAEEAAESLRNQWVRLSRHLSLVGLHLSPPPPSTTERNGNSNSSNFELDSVEELSQQIIASRLVSDAIAKGISKTEVEAEMEPIIQSKNFEISRLMDRVQYYEAANREMSQRNQEAVGELCPLLPFSFICLHLFFFSHFEHEMRVNALISTLVHAQSFKPAVFYTESNT